MNYVIILWSCVAGKIFLGRFCRGFRAVVKNNVLSGRIVAGCMQEREDMYFSLKKLINKHVMLMRNKLAGAFNTPWFAHAWKLRQAISESLEPVEKPQCGKKIFFGNIGDDGVTFRFRLG